MSKLIADIFVTIGGKQTSERLSIVKRSLQSLNENTDRNQFRLTVCLDGISEFWNDLILALSVDYSLISFKNEGLGPTINRAIAHISTVNDWYSHPTHGDPDKVAPFIVCCQDDCLYTKDWLPILASRFIAYERLKKVAFATGHNAIEHEHKTRESLDGGKIQFRDWIRMTNVLGRREYWQSLMPIPRLDPETGGVRAKPNDGVGSSVDWWLIRNHENSICKTGRTCLVMPGLVKHLGYDKSTWLNRALPESQEDLDNL